MLRALRAAPAQYEPTLRIKCKQVRSSLSVPTSGLCFAVTVPLGAQYGTDSGSAEGTGDHTKWGVIYDQANTTMYWRTEFNMNLQVGRRLVVITHSTHGT